MQQKGAAAMLTPQELKKSPLFQDIGYENYQQMLDCFQAVQRSYRVDEVIYDFSGPAGNAVGVVERGEASLIRIDEEGVATVLEELGPGGVFGKSLAFSTSGRDSLEVVCRTACDVVFIDYPHILKRCERACTHHSLLVPKDHPLTQVSPLTLEAIARWPLITYRQGITGRSRIDEAFNRKGLMPDIVLSAQDSDVIKTYVELGLGVGLVAEQSGDAREADTFTRLDTRHLFDANTVWLGLKRGQLQRNYVWRFIELCNAGLSLDEIKRQAMEPEEAAIDYQI
jgi:hypothetical protein